MPKRPQYDLLISYAAADRAPVGAYLFNALDQAGVRVYSEVALAITHLIPALCAPGGYAPWP
jgi:hypothetical protein